LNRNPQNRLGAKRDAAELKEHPFFASIDWDLLYKKQITPPFKPIVDSDESVANFDPEFTNSSLADAGIDDEITQSSSIRHSYLGPGMSLSESQGGNKAVNIQKAKRPGMPAENDGLTESVQENFRGFTYTGESVMVCSLSVDSGARGMERKVTDVQPHSMLADYPMEQEGSDNEEAVDEDDDEEEDEEEDDDDMGGSKTRRQSDVDME
jgi:hypothetical protein